MGGGQLEATFPSLHKENYMKWRIQNNTKWEDFQKCVFQHRKPVELWQPPCKEVMHKMCMVIRAVESVFW
jgi:hypothetical protein